MRRNRKLPKREYIDRLYGSPLVGKLINYVMRGGKKTTAEKVVYAALAQAGKKLEREPLALFEAALQNASPVLEVRSRRIGGATYQVPREVRYGHKTRKNMAEALGEELALAAQGQGSAIKKRDDMHKMAEANRAFAHFAW